MLDLLISLGQALLALLLLFGGALLIFALACFVTIAGKTLWKEIKKK